MRKVLVAWFSQRGTTSAVAERISAGLMAAGCEVARLEIGKGVTPDLAQFDAIGIGSPAYVYRPPFAVTDFVRTLPDLAGKPTFAFVLHGTWQGAAGNRIRRMLAAKNGRDIGYFHCFGADYFVGYLKRGYLFSPDSPTAEELEAAHRFGLSLPGRASQHAPEVEPFDPPTGFWYAFERMLGSHLLARLVLGVTIHADGSCDSCGVCVAACPTHNIELREGKRPKWGRNCLLCVSCELKCPRDAVHSPYDWAVFKPLMSYNVRQALRGPFEVAKVSHSAGASKRI
jgi:flavodoxin/NAD-dependent dihydropyrimidine dehydrogenase PreA subunit